MGRAHGELVQDAVLVALERWSGKGIPDRPDAWLFTVARRRGLDIHHLYHATRAELLRDLGLPDHARDANRRALELTTNAAQQVLLEQRLSWLPP